MTSTLVSMREVVSLMWLVTLSEFAIERELRELLGTHKRRAKASLFGIHVTEQENEEF